MDNSNKTSKSNIDKGEMEKYKQQMMEMYKMAKPQVTPDTKPMLNPILPAEQPAPPMEFIDERDINDTVDNTVLYNQNDSDISINSEDQMSEDQTITDDTEPQKAQYTPISEENLDIFTELRPKTGYLRVKTVLARGAFPAVGALVTISKMMDSTNHIFEMVKTDESGLTPIISLPTPSKKLSEQPEPNNLKPYSTYDVRVDYPEFTPIIFKDVAVFEDIVAFQTVPLVPVGVYNEEDGAIIVEKQDTRTL